MVGLPILWRASLSAAFFSVLCVAAPAQADVLEISDEGAVWVAGGPIQIPDTVQLTAEGSGQAPTSLPLAAVADPSAHLAHVPAKYRAKVVELSNRFDISPTLLEALVWQESRWRENAVSHAGARGLAQLMPATARYLGVNPDDPMQNLEGGARYLREQLDRFDGDLEKALAAYNAGPGRVIRANGIPRIRETQNYVAAILGRLSSHSRSSQ